VFSEIKIMSTEKQLVQRLLSFADIKINGNNPHDIQVYDERFYNRVLKEGTLGIGESYMEGWWDAPRLDEFFDDVFRANLEERVSGKDMLRGMVAKLTNRQKKDKAFDIGETHYDIGNALYRGMLDDRMVYTCGYWKNAKDLNEAQGAKLDLTCRKIGLEQDMTVLDIGCGWGSFAKYASEKYGAKVLGITVSKEQVELGKELRENSQVYLRLQDYRDLRNEKFDRIVSLGMLEHVGPKNYKTYMEIAKRSLKEDGLFLLHTIGKNTPGPIDKWMDKYIFPNAVLPTMEQILKASRGKFVLKDLHNFGPDYDKTLMAWNENFQKSWSKIKKDYSQEFKRMWEYYLLSCAGSFRAGKNQLWQLVFSKEGEQMEYQSVR